MKKIIEIIERQEDISAGKGASEEQIKKAEEKLGLTFAEEYISYLMKFGLVFVNGMELTGIGIVPRVDVVSMTQEHRLQKHVKPIPMNWYVIEDTCIDGIIIWQASDGSVYQETSSSIEKIADSFSEYLIEAFGENVGLTN